MKKKRKSVLFSVKNFCNNSLRVKVTLLFILMGVFHNFANVCAQSVKYDVFIKNGTLEDVFKIVEAKGMYTFLYSVEDIDKVAPLTIHEKQIELKKLLELCLLKHGLTYEINGSLIVVNQSDSLQQREKTIITGIVKDKTGAVLPGVTIVLKGTRLGCVTDIKGKFQFNVLKQDTITLCFSFMGMKTKELEYKGKPMLVILEEDTKNMEEIVVTGYQQLKKSNVAGSTSVISAKDLLFTPTNTLEQALQGKIAGMLVQNTNGLVGTRQRVRVRGTSTLLGSQEPVWVVDGIIQEDPLPFKTEDFKLFGQDNMDNFETMRNFVGSAISWLNPSDIKDITVLKDASATAIYGVKAANGVIVITTKRGEEGRLSVTYSGNFSVGSKLTYDKMELMNSKERVDVSREIYEKGYPANSSSIPPVGFSGIMKKYLEDKISYEEFNAGVKELETMNTDWFDILYENPFSHSHNISLSGGGKNSTYYVSFGITQNNGTAKGNDSETYNGRINVSSIFKERFRLSGSLSGSVSKTKGFYEIDPFKYASQTSRVIPVKAKDGSLFFYKERNSYNYNILHELAETGNENHATSLNINLVAGVDIFKGLKYDCTFSYNTSFTHGETWATELSNKIAEIRGYEYGVHRPEDTPYKESKLPHGGQLSIMENRMESWTLRNSISWLWHADRHLVTFLIGQEARKTKNDGYEETIWGYVPSRGKSIITPPVQIESYGSMVANPLYSQMGQKITDQVATYLSFYSTLSYTYDERYVFNASIRGDASNKFGQDKSSRYQPVWSIGLRWNVGREHFMENQSIVDDLSFRFSYGFQGNVCEDAGPDLIAGIPSESGIWGPTGEYYLTISRRPNPKLKWEKNKSINAGVDFTLLNNHISGSFEYYYKKGEDIVVNHAVPHCNGVFSMKMNGGTMINRGWELSLNFVPLRFNEFVWSLNMNTSKNKNEITSKLEQNTTWINAASGGLTRDGYPVSAFWAFELAGLSSDDGSPVFNFFDAENNPNVKTDATTYMKYMGKLDPDFDAGLSTSFRYKSLSLSAGFNLQIGGKKFLAPVFDSSIRQDVPSEYNNLPKELVKRWRKPGDELQTKIPSLPHCQKGRIKGPDGEPFFLYEAYNYSDQRVVDAWFLKCNNISLSYSLPEKWLKHVAQYMTLSFSVTNPFQIVSSDFKGVDPEVATGNQPITRNYNFNLSISF